MKQFIRQRTEQPLDEPYSPDKSSVPDWYNKCKSWSDCSNPQMDCINYPLRNIPLKPNVIY